MTDRDCPHGHQKGKCDTCDLIIAEKRIAHLEAAIAAAPHDQDCSAYGEDQHRGTGDARYICNCWKSRV